MIELDTAEDRAAAAGEYVLGMLDDADRSAFETAMRQDRALEAETYAWQDRLLALSLHAAPADPRPELWQRIAQSVRAAASDTLPVASPATRPVAAARPPWWQRTRPWQVFSGFAGALAVAASLMVVVLTAQRATVSAVPPARYLAVLQSPVDRSAGWVVEVETGGKVRLVPVASGAAVPAGRSLQFWTKPQGADAPTSLGLVRAGQTIELPASRLPAVGEQQLFEITLEPENGSPIGRPTGPILYVGRSVLM